MEKIYGYVLGHQAQLSKEEIKSVYRSLNIPFKVVEETADVFLVRSTQEVFERLGGSIKVFEVLEEIGLEDWRNTVLEKAGDFSGWLDKEGKVNFGVSVYGPKNEKKLVVTLGKRMKEILREEGYNARFLVPERSFLSSVVVSKNHLIEKGGEIVVFQGRKIYLGLSVKVQDFELFAKLDYDRPKSDAYSGMLPPKLAQILVNLTGLSPEGKSLLDPFCGSGTVLQQAAFLGFKDLVGSDVSPKAVSDTQRNMDWFKANFSEKDFAFEIRELDALNAGSLKRKFGAIVFEGYLGPPQKKPVDEQKIRRNAEILGEFYGRAFNQLLKVMEPGSVMVAAVPFFAVSGREIFLELSFPEGLQAVGTALRYRRPEQIVGRQILILKKV